VSLQRLGRSDEAIAKYRKALSLDPGMAPARGNLDSNYAACGNYEEGIREYRTAVELDPSSAKAREGLTRAWFARGDYPEAAREAERAEALGCRFEPSMLDALEPYRERRAPSDSP
jgi:tetratricopeptide (TPR) repeat protein